MTTSKFKATLASRNFFVSLVTLVTLALAAQGQQVEINPEQVVDTVLNRDFIAIFTVVVPNLLNPVLKIIQTGWSWAFLKSKNFWTQVITVVLMLATGFGLMFPESAVAELVEAIFGGGLGAIVTAVVVNLVNPLYHFIFDRTPSPAPVSG